MAEEISPLENHGWWMHQLRKDAKANRPEALRLANALTAQVEVGGGDLTELEQAATELRRLHALNGELLEALQSIADCCDEDHAARDYASRQTEIRGIARAAIAKAEEVKP
jgi:hypothetical protein